jgi:multimeric flavodoxin WrbA
MKAIAVNGSPRKTWNTAALLEHALAGAAAKGAETELVHLYDHDFTGCVSCFACKKIGGKSYGRCAVNDGLAPILEKAAGADILLLGTPVYFGAETGEMRSFLERLLFQFLTYTPDYASLFPGRLRVGLVYTMNVPEQYLPTFGYDKTFAATRGTLSRFSGTVIFCCLRTPTSSATIRSIFQRALTPGQKKTPRGRLPRGLQARVRAGEKLAASAKG